MKTKFILIFIIGIGLVLNTCRKDGDMDEMTFEESIQHEALNKEEVVFWDKQKSITLTADDILLPNGLTIREFNLDDSRKKGMEVTNENPVNLKNRIICEMGETALYLTDRSKHNYPAMPGIGPKQNGLAYSYGQRHFAIREIPPVGDCGDPLMGVGDAIHGLDCSGFIYQLFMQSDIDLTKNTWADKQRNPDEVKKAIKKKYPDFDKLKVEDLGNIPISKFKTGDIIYWLRYEDGKWKAKHIGMILKNKNGILAVAQSNGDGYDGCVENLSEKRGPRFCKLELSVLSSTPGFGSNYGIVRIGVDIDPPDVNLCKFSIHDIKTYNTETKPGSSRNYITQKASFSSGDYTGEFTENVFKGKYTGTPGVNASGYLLVYLSEDFMKVDSLMWGYSSGSTSYETTRSAKIINLEKQAGPYFYLATGNTSCNHIKSLVDEFSQTNGLNTKLTKFECTGETEIWIGFDKQ